MVKNSKYTLGTRSGEIISVPYELISVRLKDGTFFGPKLYLGTDDKQHIEEGYSPLTYNQEELSIIQTKAWNRRRGSLLEGIEELKASIKAVGRVLEPVDLLKDGPYLGSGEGHRRHICVTWLNQEGISIPTIPALIYTAGYGDQGNWENFEYQQWFRNQKQPLSIIEKADFIQEKLASGVTKEDFCKKVGISTSEFDTIMVIAGQSSEVRELVEKDLISPTTIKIAKAAADRKDWTQSQFESFLQDSVKLAQEAGRNRVSATMATNLISTYTPSTSPTQSNSSSQSENAEAAANKTKDNKTNPTTNKGSTTDTKPPKAKVRPTAKEIEKVFLKLMMELRSDFLSQDETEVEATFPKDVWDLAMEYWNRIPEKEIEKLREKES